MPDLPLMGFLPASHTPADPDQNKRQKMTFLHWCEESVLCSFENATSSLYCFGFFSGDGEVAFYLINSLSSSHACTG